MTHIFSPMQWGDVQEHTEAMVVGKMAFVISRSLHGAPVSPQPGQARCWQWMQGVCMGTSGACTWHMCRAADSTGNQPKVWWPSSKESPGSNLGTGDFS
jgi:hypothetical protein